MEIWKRHPEFSDYEVSSYGRVRKGLKILSQRKEQLYYTRVCLYVNGKRKTKRVHRLVGETFLQCPSDLCVLHKDETLSPEKINAVSNLWIGTRRDNHIDRDRKQRGYLVYRSHPKLNAVLERYGRGDKMPDIARSLSLSYMTVYHMCKRKREEKKT